MLFPDRVYDPVSQPGGAEPGVHVQKIAVGGDPLRNDTEVTVTQLTKGITISCDDALFKGSVLKDLPAPLSSTAQYLRTHYDMKDHTRSGAAHTAGIGDEFVDWFAIAGPPERALPRFRALAALGLDFCYVVPGSTGVAREIATASLLGLAQDVLPALRA